MKYKAHFNQTVNINVLVVVLFYVREIILQISLNWAKNVSKVNLIHFFGSKTTQLNILVYSTLYFNFNSLASLIYNFNLFWYCLSLYHWERIHLKQTEFHKSLPTNYFAHFLNTGLTTLSVLAAVKTQQISFFPDLLPS